MEIKKIFEIKIEIHPNHRRYCSNTCEHLHCDTNGFTCDLTTVNGRHTELTSEPVGLNIGKNPGIKYGVKTNLLLITRRTKPCIKKFGEGL
jgi:hypothetical protein